MKVLTVSILCSMLLVFSCKTCPKCPVIHEPVVVSPTVACFVPENYVELQKKFSSTEGAITDGDLLVIVSNNVKMMELVIKQWEGYRFCVEKSISIYNDLAKKINESPEESKDKSK